MLSFRSQKDTCEPPVIDPSWSLEEPQRTLQGGIMRKPGRQVTESEFGSITTTVSGTKVDMSLRIKVNNEWRSEIIVFEFKTASTSQHACNIQQRKSVRLNAAILVDLGDRGLDVTRHYPVVAEGKSLNITFTH